MWLRWIGGDPAWVAHCWIFTLIADEKTRRWSVYYHHPDRDFQVGSGLADLEPQSYTMTREMAEAHLKKWLQGALGELQP